MFETTFRPAEHSPGQADLVGRTVDLLLSFSRERPQWGITELAAALSMTKSRVHRIVKTLESKAVLARSDSNRRYRLGLRMFELGAMAAENFGGQRLLRPLLAGLAAEMAATIVFRLRDGDEIVLLESVENPGPVRVVLPFGTRYPIYYGAAGMAISAALAQAELRALVPDGPLRQFAPHSFRSGRQFRSALRQVRELGYALSDERVQPGVRSVGVAVRGADGGVVGALVAGFAKSELTESTAPRVSRRLQQAAEELSVTLARLNLLGFDITRNYLRQARR